jgi:hypothetical protein
MLEKNLKEQLTRLFDRMSEEAIALLRTQPQPETVAPEPTLEWMTASQLARYWQLVNANGEPTTAGITKWARRSASEHPLPHAYMGDLLRFHRDEADLWAREEAERRRTQNEKRRLRIA